VNCTLPPLVPTKDAAGTYDRTVEWTLIKTVTPANHSGFAGESFLSAWEVIADKTETLDNYQVTGTITITNPAQIAQTFTVGDVLDDGTAADVTCSTETLEPGESVVCTYTALPADASATLNTATVSAPGNAVVEATATVSFNENLIGYDSGTLSDERFGFSETISADITETFPETFTCSTASTGASTCKTPQRSR